jgi:hypothetical protein
LPISKLIKDTFSEILLQIAEAIEFASETMQHIISCSILPQAIAISGMIELLN